jgi:hypothetical protein
MIKDIGELLAAEAEAAEAHRGAVRAATLAGRQPAHPRRPAGQAAARRRRRRVEPSALMRQWVLDRLDAEKAPCGEASDAELLRGKPDTPAGCWTRSPRPKNAPLADTGA